MNQSCMRCKALKFEEMVPRCAKGCAAWDEALFEDSRYLNDHHPLLRTGDMVEMGGKFFFVEADRFDEYQNGMRELSAVTAADLCDIPDDASNEEVAQLRAAVLEDYLDDVAIHRAEDLDDEQVEEFETMFEEALMSEQEIAEEAALRGFSSERYHGLRYHFLGRFYQAIIEPVLWNHGCEQGVHRFLNQPFSANENVASADIAAISHSVNKAKTVVERLAKVMWAEKQLQLLATLKVVPAHCSCGAPMHPTLSQCEWCEEDAKESKRDRTTQYRFTRAARQVVNATPKAKQIPATVTIVDIASKFAEALPQAFAFFTGLDMDVFKSDEIECPI
jgi:hypothetical protein